MAEIKNLLIENEILKHNINALKNQIFKLQMTINLLQQTIKLLQQENERMLAQDKSLTF